MNNPAITQFKRFHANRTGGEALFDNRKSRDEIQSTYKVKDTTQTQVHRNHKIF